MSAPDALISDTVAAVDLGSNSFHMVVARRHHGDLQVLDRLKLMVRLGEGLDRRGRLHPDVRNRALDALQKFGQRLQGLPRGCVRVVGTNTLREMRDARAFMAAAEEALGHPVEVVSGVEEARLIYLGVARSLADDGRRRLVVDIGGGSTELVLGQGLQPRRMDSLEVGCVSITRRFFPEGRWSKRTLNRAELEVGVAVEPVIGHYRDGAWDAAVGASGTIKAVQAVIAELGGDSQCIQRDDLADLRARVLRAGRSDRLDLSGLEADRRPVFAAGVVVLQGIFRALGIERMAVSDGALREGVIHDLVGRIEYHDVRDQTVAALASRYHVDTEHAARVARTADALFEQAAGPWALDGEARRWLDWAARLHEIGLDIAHGGYHRHGEYVARNGDLGGFSGQDQAVLGALIRCHRRKVARKALDAVPESRQHRVWRLVPLLRLAVILHRSRLEEQAPALTLTADGARLTLAFPEGWLATHPLTAADLEAEAQALARVGFTLEIPQGPMPGDDAGGSDGA
ncbi:Ppx/GppA phosphatase family protein [Aquisalimonas lutea]|uniref:Ppx/GppA phosphatase family protein n=1 Tax=Aquisalimonas lutea TaxID=1327750 RepID=UPI0025B32A0A|nr:Ppx/GppA phosphatase family protein [Aquisalimonas lutea]MDN3518616.1 Ppx/GppA phosphatase family protein [Aquisalimonas lutea]